MITNHKATWCRVHACCHHRLVQHSIRVVYRAMACWSSHKLHCCDTKLVRLVHALRNQEVVANQELLMLQGATCHPAAPAHDSDLAEIVAHLQATAEIDRLDQCQRQLAQVIG